MTNAELLQKLSAVCGAADVVCGDAAGDKYLRDFLGAHRGRALAVVKPKTTAQVSEIVKLCAQTNTPIVPQGGNTGYRAGCIPDESGRTIVVAMEKMRAAPEINAAGKMMTARAGCILQDLQNAAAEHDLFFPLDLGAKGSCHIGGNLATNAGGVNFLRYGGARELCIGLEAVLPSGEVADLLRGARKHNAGYDLKNLLIGSEGTLGIITAATLKLFPRPFNRAAAFVAVRGFAEALALADLCQKHTGGMTESLELMPRVLFAVLRKHFPNLALPFSEPPPLAVLAEAAGEGDVAGQLQDAVAAATEDGVADAAVFALSESRRREFWTARELAPEATRREGKWIKLDVCLPLHRLAAFAEAAETAAGEGTHIIAFGHLGDGNLHLSLRPQNRAPEDAPALAEKITARILQLAQENGGSFSAEHGIGRTHAALLQKYGNPAALAAMRAIKKTIDPRGIMNPGALFAD